LQLSEIALRADNIRNLHYRGQVYPSPFHADSVVFDKGRATIDGKANFLEKPFPGVIATYQVERIPLDKFEPEVQRAQLIFDFFAQFQNPATAKDLPKKAITFELYA